MKISSLPHGCVGQQERPLSLLEWVAMAGRSGCLDGLELMDMWFDEAPARETNMRLLNEVKDAMLSAGLSVSMVSVHGPFISSSPKRRAAEIEHCVRYLGIAAELGTDLLRVVAHVVDPSEEISREDALALFSEMIEPVVRLADDQGIGIVLENHPGLIATTADLQGFLDRVNLPSLGVNFDTKNSMRSAERPELIAERAKLLERVRYLHLDNYRLVGEGLGTDGPALSWDRSVPAFDGEVDLRTILSSLKSSGFDGWIAVEYGGTVADHVIQTACQLRELWTVL